MNNHVVKCEQCGLEYSRDFDSDIKEHRNQHKCWQAAQTMHGTMRTYDKRETEKQLIRRGLDNFSGDWRLLVVLYTNLMRIYFESSVSLHGYSRYKKHPKFEQFAAMLLNQDAWKAQCSKYSPLVYEELVKKFGVLPGIGEEDVYWRGEGVQYDVNSGRLVYVNLE